MGLRDTSCRCRGGIRMRYTLWQLVFILAAAPPLCHGQTSAMNGEITGTITDPSGAAVPDAIVRITNTGTGLKQSTRTVDSGLYRFALLPVGSYDLEYEAPGF